MTIYDFLERLLAEGGLIEDLDFVNMPPEVPSTTFKHLQKLIEEYLEKSPEGRMKFNNSRRFGFDKGSYIGDIEVRDVRRVPRIVKRLVSNCRVGVRISRPRPDR